MMTRPINPILNPIFELHLLMGLPASGKSYWAKENFNTNTTCNHTGDFIVDLDKYLHYENYNLTTPVIYSAFNDSDMKHYVGGELQNTRKVVKACIDGLITTIDDLTKVIDSTLTYIANRYTRCDYQIKIYVHQWNEDRDTCLHNDKMRVNSGERKVDSKVTICTHPYEYIQKDQLKKYRENSHIVAIKFERHGVKKLNLYDTMFAPCIGYDRYKYNSDRVTKTKYMYSESWSAGGTWGNCWGDEGTISPDKPLNFKELDELFEKICPNITYLQYKKIQQECVEIDEYTEHDYYGGIEHLQRWKCDLEKLYEMLKEMKLIKEI